ncbi:hypothetical protein DL93DRAFT_1772372 [Clavulina sp. PMI_390]|nr:hypothetical protein DL93DRAFT_1772372 [Clavulina sp. PMI_390]
MSNNPFGDDELDGAWGISSRPSGDDVLKDALKKEQLIKDIMAAQADLRGSAFLVLVERVDKTQGEVDKLASSNGMLQTYVDNLSKQMAGGGGRR